MEQLSKTGVATQERVSKYDQQVKFNAAGGEPISNEFIDNAITVLKRMMSIHDCTVIVLRFAGQGVGNPHDNIYKLHKIIVRVDSYSPQNRKIENLTWTLSMMEDFWMSGALQEDQFSIRHLQAKGVRSISWFSNRTCFGTLLATSWAITSSPPATNNNCGTCAALWHTSAPIVVLLQHQV